MFRIGVSVWHTCTELMQRCLNHCTSRTICVWKLMWKFASRKIELSQKAAPITKFLFARISASKFYQPFINKLKLQLSTTYPKHFSSLSWLMTGGHLGLPRDMNSTQANNLAEQEGGSTIPVATDNRRNVVSASSEAPSQIGCFAHQNNLAAQKATGINQVSMLLGRVRSVVSFSHHSTIAL